MERTSQLQQRSLSGVVVKSREKKNAREAKIGQYALRFIGYPDLES